MSKKEFSKMVATTVAAVLVTTMAAPVAGATTSTGAYKDQASISSWAKDATAYLTEQGIMQGYNGNFLPSQSITFGEVAKVMAVSLGLVKDEQSLDASIKTGFKNVDGHWSAPYFKLLLDFNEDIFSSYSDDTMNPNQEINRAQLAGILVSSAGLVLDEDVVLNVGDSKDYSVLTLASHGIVNGDAKGLFGPELTVSRETAAVLVHRTLVEDVRVSAEKNSLVKEVIPEGYVLSIMHQNDTHASLVNAPKTISAIKQYRQSRPESLLLHAGDVFSGTLYFNTFQGKADLALMKLVNYDAMTFGNHEFDLGDSDEGHQALVDFIKGANFPFVSSNVDFSADKKFTGLFSDISSSDPENGKIYNGIIKEVNGEKIGIFGLTTVDTKGISSPKLVTFEDYLEEAQKAVKAFEDMGVDKIVALSHLGYDDNSQVDNDLTLAAKVEGIDIIVGGHTHTRLDAPIVITKDAQGNDKAPTIIVQANASNTHLGTLDVVFDEKGTVKYTKGKLLTVADYKEDKEAAAVLAPFTEEIKEKNAQKIGVFLEQDLVSPRLGDEGNTSGISVRNSETILGNIITDGMLIKAKQYAPDVVLAITNGGGIRKHIPAGDISIGDVINVLPNNNTLATMEITGSDLKAAFEWSLKEFPKENGGFLHLSGGKVEFDSTKPDGQRVVAIYIKDETGELTEIKEEETYTVASNVFTAKGGDNYAMFKKLYEAGKVTDLGLSDWENLRDHLISIKDAIPTELEGRIVDVSKN